MAKRHRRKMNAIRRNAIILNDEDEIFDEKVGLRERDVKTTEATAAATAGKGKGRQHAGSGKGKQTLTTAAEDAHSPSSEDGDEGEEDDDEAPTAISPRTHHIRIGRRTTEDEIGDIPTQFIVVAKIDPGRDNRLTWLSVATWQLNGLRIGNPETGDPIREDDEVLGFSTGLDPDPYFFARNVLSVARIREHLLARLENGETIDVVPETLDDDIAQTERTQASYTRLAEDFPNVAVDEGMRSVVGQDARRRFPHPWALPAAPTKSREGLKYFKGNVRSATSRGRSRTRKNSTSTAMQRFPGLPAFNSVGRYADRDYVNIIATFVNKLDDHNLRLKHFVQVDFELNESVYSAKKYFCLGDGGEGGGDTAHFPGLEKNSYLSRKHWALELWVLPQVEGCSTLFKWDDVKEMPARAFCDEKALELDDGQLKLYVEVRIVRDPMHVGSESEKDEE